jgi:hypothetical protein
MLLLVIWPLPLLALAHTRTHVTCTLMDLAFGLPSQAQAQSDQDLMRKNADVRMDDRGRVGSGKPSDELPECVFDSWAKA